MKKIGIFTITDYLNYGNRLQNYAAQEIFRKRGYDVTSIANVTIPPVIKGEELLKLRLQNLVKQSPASLYEKIKEKLEERKNRDKYIRGRKAKDQSFREFSARHIKETDYVVSPKSFPADLGTRFDYFIVGSDQIWNPNIRYGSPLDFLAFADVNKRIALAPSFGVSVIPEKYRDDYRRWIFDMKYVSVREDKGATIIRELTGKEVPVLIDPTLMLSREEWFALSDEADIKQEKPYLLTYFIGSLSDKRKRILKKMASDRGLELIMMASLDDMDHYAANPAEFVALIRSASIVCTDSFHAIIFSMIMNRPFVVFDREGKSAPMSSRIETLLKKFHFENRKYSMLIHNGQFTDIDFSHVDHIIEKEREKVNKYLDQALKEA